MISRILHVTAICTLLLLTRCVPPAQTIPPADLATAEKALLENLLNQFNAKQQATMLIQSAESLTGNTTRSPNTLIMDYFVDQDTGQINKTSVDMLRVFQEYQRVRFPNLNIIPMSETNLQKASYVIVGKITYELFPPASTGTSSPGRYFRLYGSIVSLQNGNVIASSSAWISNPTLDQTLSAFYNKSPMYLKGYTTGVQAQVAEASAGSGNGREYINIIETEALTQDAITALNDGNYAKAKELFQRSLATPSGKNLKNYVGIYESYYGLNDRVNAAKAYGDLFAAGVREHNIGSRMNFKVDSIEFIDDPSLKDEYDIWLHEIAKYFAESPDCLLIVGNASDSGLADYNQTLSEKRSANIKKKLTSYASSISGRVLSAGAGFRCPLIITTNEIQGTPNRRVEFIAGQCDMLTNLARKYSPSQGASADVCEGSH